MKSCVNYPNSNSWKSDNLRKGNKGKKKKVILPKMKQRRLRVITLHGVIEKSTILLSQIT